MSLVPCATSLLRLIDHRQSLVCKATNWELDNLLRLENVATLKGHQGCVNRLSFNEEGSLLLSGSDDCRLLVWDVAEQTLLHQIETGHSRNIFGVRFMPCTNDRLLASCAMDCTVRVTSLDGDIEKLFEVHEDRVKTIDVERRNPNLIFSASEDGSVKQIDIRTNEEPISVVKTDRTFLKSAMLNPSFPYELVVSSSSPNICVYDRRVVSTQSNGTFSEPKAKYLPSHLCFGLPFSTFSCFNETGTAIAASYCYECVYVFSTQVMTNQEPVKEQFKFMPEKYNSNNNVAMRNLHRSFHYLLLSYEYYHKNRLDKTLVWFSKAYDICKWNELLLCRWILYCFRGWPGDTDAVFVDIRNFFEGRNANQVDQIPFLISPCIIKSFCERFLDIRYLYRHFRFAQSISTNMGEDVDVIVGEMQEEEDQLLCELGKFEETFQLEEWWLSVGRLLLQDRQLCTEQHMREFIQYWIAITMKEMYRLSRKLRNELAQLVHDALIRGREEEQRQRLTRTICSRTKSEQRVMLNLPRNLARPRSLEYHRRLMGHLSINTDIKEVQFIPGKSPCILSGSDDGCFYFWSLDSGLLLGAYRADTDAVNCVLPHPYQPLVATSGIDHDIKLWIPGALGDAIDESEMDKLLKNNMDKLDDIQRRAEGMDEAVFFDPMIRYLLRPGRRRHEYQGTCNIH